MRIPDIVIGDGYSGKEEMVRARYGEEDERRMEYLTAQCEADSARLGAGPEGRSRQRTIAHLQCIEPGCTVRQRARGWCAKHYWLNYRRNL